MQQLVLVSVCSWIVVGSVGCRPAVGVEGWVDGQRSAAESVCGCASTLGQSVETCLDNFDTAAIEEAQRGYDCIYGALELDPEAESTIDCIATSFWELDDCASSSRCEEGRVDRCLDQHEVRIARCPIPTPVFTDALDLCNRQLRVEQAPAQRYVSAVATRDGHSPEWRSCMLESFALNEVHVFGHAVCAVPHIDRYNECGYTSREDCASLLTPSYACPPLPQPLLDWQTLCTERY